MRTALKILLGLFAVGVLAFTTLIYFTSDLTAVADEFFLAVKDDDMDKAYSYLSKDFRSGTTQRDLQHYLKHNSLSNFREASWQSRSINGGRGDLKGSITTDSGGVVPISLSFINGENSWKIYSIQKPSAGILEETSSSKIPSEQDLVLLSNQSMGVFAESVNDKSMVKFHSHVSNLWQQQFTVEQLDDAFRAFYDSGLDLTVLEHYSPHFTPKPSIGENELLLIEGYYPTQPNQINFKLKYVYEGLSWKLLSISTDVK